MIELTFKNIKFRMDIGFLAVIALISVSGSYGLYASAACIVHECGHILMTILFGYRIRKIFCSITGIEILSDPIRLHSFTEDILIIYGGIIANIISGIILFNAGSQLFAAVNFAAAAINILPFSVLDGGTALNLAIDRYGGAVHREKILAVSEIIITFVSFLMFFCFGRYIFCNLSAVIFWLYVTGSEMYSLALRIFK